MSREGVIRFRLDFRSGPAPDPGPLEPLFAWREVFVGRGWLGQDPARYGGLGFGNVSRRDPADPEAFLISATQTGHLPWPDARGYSRVTAHDVNENRIVAEGPAPPSSEALTHAAVYGICPTVGFVFHVHAPELWRAAPAQGVPCVPEDVAYGTPAMARAVGRLAGAGAPVLAMLGHRDGMVAVGATAREAGVALLELGARCALREGNGKPRGP